MKLTDTQMAILTAAAHQPEHLAVPPERLPAAARQTVAKALLKNDLVIAVQRPAYDAQALWMVDGDSVLLKITDEGLRAIGMAPQGAAPATDAAPTGAPEAPTQANPADATEPAQASPAAPDDATRAEDLALLDQALAAPGPKPRASLRDTAAAVLAACLVRTGCPWRHLPPPRPSRLGPRCTAIGAPSCGTEAGRASAAARRSRWCLRGGWLKGHSAGSEDSDACRRTTRRCPRSPSNGNLGDDPPDAPPPRPSQSQATARPMTSQTGTEAATGGDSPAREPRPVGATILHLVSMTGMGREDRP